MKINICSVLVEDQDKAPTKMGPVTVAVFDDTCGNNIQKAML